MIGEMEEEIIGLDDRKSGEKEGRDGAEEEAVLPGFRFHPTDEELVGFYLRRKVEKKPISIEIIKEIDIYKYDPWDLPRVSSTVGEKEWYFFCLRGRKYRNSIRPNRVTGSGFWKATGIDRPICSARSSGGCIGLKKSLVYYQGSAGKGTKTQWMMHEYRLPSSPPFIQEAEIWTICRIIKRTNASFKKYTQQLSWKEANDSNQTPVDSGSKTSSFESDGGREEKKVLERAYSFQHGESYVGHNYMEETAGQVCASAGQYWNNNDADGYSSTLRTSSNVNEIFREGNWDEIGRMVDYLMEAATTYETVYF